MALGTLEYDPHTPHILSTEGEPYPVKPPVSITVAFRKQCAACSYGQKHFPPAKEQCVFVRSPRNFIHSFCGDPKNDDASFWDLGIKL